MHTVIPYSPKQDPVTSEYQAANGRRPKHGESEPPLVVPEAHEVANPDDVPASVKRPKDMGRILDQATAFMT